MNESARMSGARVGTRESGILSFALWLACCSLLVAAPSHATLQPVNSAAAPDSIASPVLQDPATSGFQEIIVELRAGQEARDTQPAYLADGRVWVPALVLCRLVELDASVDSTLQLRGFLEPGHRHLSLDPFSRRANRDSAWRQLRAHELFVYQGQLYASTAVMAWLLDTQVYEDLSEMTVTFDPVDRLPLGRRLRRERLRRLEAAKSIEPDLVLEPKVDAWSGATLDWDLSSPSLDRPEISSYATSFGGSALGGGLDLRYRGRMDGHGLERLDARWQGVWPQQNWLRQLSLGRTLSGGPRPRAITGVSLGNSPFLRSSDFGRVVLRGRLDPGWEVEIYRDGRLLAWDRVDDRGRWEFVVPLDYGQNPVEIRAYGPHGELQITRRAVRVDFDRLPAHHLEYDFSAGRVENHANEDMLELDLRYGVSERWTVRGGYESYHRSDAPDEHHPYLSLSSSPINALHVFAERVHDAWWRGVASIEPNGDLRLSAEHTRFDRVSFDESLSSQDYFTPAVGSRLEKQRSIGSFFYRPFHHQRNLFLTFDGQRHRYEDDVNLRASWGATVLSGGNPWRSSVERGMGQGPGGYPAGQQRQLPGLQDPQYTPPGPLARPSASIPGRGGHWRRELRLVPSAGGAADRKIGPSRAGRPMAPLAEGAASNHRHHRNWRTSIQQHSVPA